MRRVCRWAAVAVLVAGYASPSAGAGFLIFEEGAKALGMGGAFTARADDPSAVFYNPAGLCALDGTMTYLGGSLIVTGTDFAGVDPDPGFGVLERTKTHVFTPISFYVTRKINENVSAGFGLFNPFGLGREWKNPETFSGRHISYKVDLKTFYFNPTIAWKINDAVSFGAGLQLVYSSVLLRQYLLMWDPNGSGFLNIADVKLTANNTLDAGFNAGVMYRNEKISVGLTYRSSVAVDYDGDGTFTQVPSGNDALDGAVSSLLPGNQGVGTRIEFPPLVSLGVAFRHSETMTFEIDLNWAGWSTFDTLPFDFRKDAALNTVRPQEYSDVFSVRAGAEYRPMETWAFRAGYYFDPSPQPDKSVSPLLPDSDRHGITFGFGHRAGAWTVDMYDLILVFLERDTNGHSHDGYNGSYASWANLIGLNVGYSF
jgi:long-chain fatty acid transport protein